MFNVVLFNPQIPHNTGAVIRLCANTGSTLHLIKPLGFTMDDKKLRRSGLDYHEFASVSVYDSFADYVQTRTPSRILALTTRGRRYYSEQKFMPDDSLLFGSETSGLPDAIRDSLPAEQLLRIPMLPDSRSMNLANSVSVVVYEAWRQNGFVDAQ